MMHGWRRRAIELLRPRTLDRDALEELSHHIDLLVERKMASGIGEPEARRLARLEAGSVTGARALIAEDRTGFAFEQLGREITYATRVLRRSPGVAALSIVTMGVGIGVSALLFTLVDGIVLRPLPYPESEQLVRIFDTNLQAGIDRTGVASGNIDDWRERAGVFDGVAGYYAMGRTVSLEGEADVLITAQVSGDFFPLLRIPPVVGRAFSNEEVERSTFNTAAAPTGPDPVVMLSHRVWMQRFGGNPQAVGATVVIDRRPFRIVGVMGPGFAMPDRGVQLWIPWDLANGHPRDQHYLAAIARLKAGVSREQAEDRLNAVARELAEEFPTTNRGWGVRLSPLAVETIGDAGSTLWLLLSAVGLVLVVACANVALLSLIRGLDRREETAVRLALGASSSRVLRESLWESALLAALAGALGAAIGVAGVRLLPTVTTDLPRLNEVVFDVRAVLFILTVTIVTAVLTGWPQVWRTRVALLAGGSRRTTQSTRSHWLRDGIVVVHVAMAAVLLIGAGLLFRSVLSLQRSDAGFDPRGVLVLPVFLDNQVYDSGEKTRTYYRTLFERLSALPGVMAVGGATTVPTSPLGPDFERPVWPEDATPDPAQRTTASVRMVTPGYLRALGLRVVDGRAIDETDAPAAPRVLMVSQTLASRLWPGGTAVGKRLVVDYSTAGTYPYEIVGVLNDVKFRGPRSTPLAEIYLPHAQRSYLILNVVVKSAGDPRALIPAVRQAMKSIDPQKPAQGMYPLEELIGATYARDRQVMVTLLLFAGAAVFLAVLSVYGVLSQRVREKSREIGIRVAMGADPARVLGWVAARGLRLIALGLAIGGFATWTLAGTIDGLLFGVAATDGVTTIAALAGVAVVGGAATLVPSWRAARIDPVQVLRRG
jgi:putative ABC transport system permease protein